MELVNYSTITEINFEALAGSLKTAGTRVPSANCRRLWNKP